MYMLVLPSSAEERVKYKYKEYEKFNLDTIIVEGDTGSPGDISIKPRFGRKYRNKLPYRRNFNPEIRKAIERIR